MKLGYIVRGVSKVKVNLQNPVARLLVSITVTKNICTTPSQETFPKIIVNFRAFLPLYILKFLAH